MVQSGQTQRVLRPRHTYNDNPNGHTRGRVSVDEDRPDSKCLASRCACGCECACMCVGVCLLQCMLCIIGNLKCLVWGLSTVFFKLATWLTLGLNSYIMSPCFSYQQKNSPLLTKTNLPTSLKLAMSQSMSQCLNICKCMHTHKSLLADSSCLLAMKTPRVKHWHLRHQLKEAFSGYFLLGLMVVIKPNFDQTTNIDAIE